MAITLDGTNGVTTPDLTVDTDTLTVDATNNRVGIGTTTPVSALDTVGILNITNSAAGDADTIELSNYSGDSSVIKSKRGLVLSADYDNNSGASQSDIRFETDGSERMRINSSGNITTPAQPSIYLQGNNGTNINFTSGQQLLVSTYYTQTYTRGGMSWNSSTGRVTVPTTGHYLMTFAEYENGNSGRVEIRKNGSNINLIQAYTNGTNAHSFVYEMSANDYIEIVADSFDLPLLYMGVRHTHFSLNLLG